jgi:hypothetical protein
LESGGIISLETGWRLALAWYHDRLEKSWRRKSVLEAQALFTSLDLASRFWQLDA